MKKPERIHSMTHMVAIGLFFLMTGCWGSNNELPTLFPLKGSVSYDGAPVQEGLVSIEPMESAGMLAPSSYARIVNGQYETDKPNLVQGEYTVLVRARDTTIPVTAEGESVDLFKPYRMQIVIPTSDNTLNIQVPARKSKR